jgi:hypothetical protein
MAPLRQTLFLGLQAVNTRGRDTPIQPYQQLQSWSFNFSKNGETRSKTRWTSDWYRDQVTAKRSGQ